MRFDFIQDEANAKLRRKARRLEEENESLKKLVENYKKVENKKFTLAELKLEPFPILDRKPIKNIRIDYE